MRSTCSGGPERPRRRRYAGRRAGLAAAALLSVALVAGGCGTSDGSADQSPSPGEESSMTTSDRPSMEQVLATYAELEADVQRALDEELGEQPWQVAGSSSGQRRSQCADVPDGQRVSLPVQSFPGTYPRGDWERAVDVVQRVGRDHGFTETGTIVDREDELEVFGEDAYGARYVFGMGSNTGWLLSTGCHAWDEEPADAPAPSGVPDYAKKD
jgi:hypothetical protein